MLQYAEHSCFVCKKIISYRMEVEVTSSGINKIFWQPVDSTPNQQEISRCPRCRAQVSRYFGYSFKASQ